MRLLSVIHGPVYGGAHSQLLRLRRPLEEHGWETAALLPEEPGNGLSRLRDAGVDVSVTRLHRLRATPDPRVQARFAAGLWPEVSAIRRLIRDRGIDVVQAHGPTNPHAALAAHLEGVAVVWQIYDTVAPMPVRKATMPVVKRLADALTVWGEELAKGHPGAHEFGDRLIIVFPPVDSQEFRPDEGRRVAARARLSVPAGAVVVGTVGNRNPTKGHEWLVRAGSIVRTRHPDVVFRILGAHSPPHAAYEEGVRSEARERGLGDPQVLDFLDPGPNVVELLPAFDVFAMTSVERSEGIPTVILEAMACGIPVVATDVGAIRELVEDGVTGLLAPAGDERAIGSAVERLVENAELRATMGAAARHRVEERYDVRRLAPLHLRAYELALEHRKARNG